MLLSVDFLNKLQMNYKPCYINFYLMNHNVVNFLKLKKPQYVNTLSIQSI